MYRKELLGGKIHTTGNLHKRQVIFYQCSSGANGKINSGFSGHVG
jgi:hypothetical protein